MLHENDPAKHGCEFGVFFDGRTPPELYEAYLIRLREQFQKVSPEAGILSGVRELLNTLKKEGVVMGLLTGNLEAGAWIKLERFGLDQYFSFGAFGAGAAPRRAAVIPATAAEDAQHESAQKRVMQMYVNH